MNWAELERDWTRATPLLRTHWTKLSDGELARIDGRRDVLAACLQRLYGFGPMETEQAIAAFEQDVRFPGAVK